MQSRREVIVLLDVMYVCDLLLAVSNSRALKFGTVEVLLIQKRRTLLASLKWTKVTFARGFLVSRVAAENECRAPDPYQVKAC